MEIRVRYMNGKIPTHATTAVPGNARRATLSGRASHHESARHPGDVLLKREGRWDWRRAHRLALAVPTPGFELLSGEPVVGGLHGLLKHMFCGHCMA
jgi:hypothetical protein